MKKRKLNSTGRTTLVIITGIFFLLFFMIGYLFVDMAVTGQKKNQNLYEYALRRLESAETVYGQRGSIYDRAGNPLAEQMTSYTMYANLFEDYGNAVEDIEDTASKLSDLIDLSKEEIMTILSRDVKQVEFGAAGRGLTFLEMEAIEALGLKGIKFRENFRRLYPNGVFASHTIGYTQLNQATNQLVGEMGIELYFDELLTGTNGSAQYLSDKKGYLLPNREKLIIEEAVDGYEVHLTLDSGIQTLLESALDKVWRDVNPESLMAIIANPKTGEILAMGNRSSFDPNIRNIENFHNSIISAPFEPGSTLKVYTYAAAINEGKYQGNQILQSGVRTLKNGAVIKDYNSSWGAITYDEGFYRSSNTAIIDMLENWITPEKNLNYLQQFGFGQPVGIELPSESGGTLPLNAELTQRMTVGFGQGLLTTPLQHIQAITAILNGGELLRPHLVSKIYDPNTNEIISEFQREVIGQPITEKTANQVKQLMIGVVEDRNGSGRLLYQLDGITSGGKTGTSQISNEKGYIPNAYVYSYIGFAPADDPQLVMYLAMDRPTSGTGHKDLSTIYQFVMNNALKYQGINSVPLTDINDIYQQIEVPKLMNQTIQKAQETMENLALELVIIGDQNQIFSQWPQAKTTVIAGGKVFAQTSLTDTLPDFTGWTRSEVKQYATMLGLMVNFSGEGFIIEQSLEPGTSVKKGDQLIITLAPLT